MATSSRSKITRSTSSEQAKKTSVKSVRKASPRKVGKTSTVQTQPTAPKVARSSRMTREQIITTLRKPQILIPIAILLAIVVVFLLKSWFVVAVVNGQLITRPALDTALEQQYGKQTLSGLVTEKLLEQEANKKGIPVTQADVDNQMKKISQQLASQGTTLDAALAAQGMNKAQLEDQLKLQELLNKLLGDKIKVSDKEVQDYIDKNKDTLPTGESDAQLKATVKQQLQRDKLNTNAQALIQKLQSQAHTTYFINF